MTGPAAQAIQDLRHSLGHTVALCDAIIFREASSDATLARTRLHPALHLLIARSHRVIEALGPEGQP